MEVISCKDLKVGDIIIAPIYSTAYVSKVLKLRN